MSITAETLQIILTILITSVAGVTYLNNRMVSIEKSVDTKIAKAEERSLKTCKQLNDQNREIFNLNFNHIKDTVDKTILEIKESLKTAQI